MNLGIFVTRRGVGKHAREFRWGHGTGNGSNRGTQHAGYDTPPTTETRWVDEVRPWSAEGWPREDDLCFGEQVNLQRLLSQSRNLWTQFWRKKRRRDALRRSRRRGIHPVRAVHVLVTDPRTHGGLVACTPPRWHVVRGWLVLLTLPGDGRARTDLGNRAFGFVPARVLLPSCMGDAASGSRTLRGVPTGSTRTGTASTSSSRRMSSSNHVTAVSTALALRLVFDTSSSR